TPGRLVENENVAAFDQPLADNDFLLITTGQILRRLPYGWCLDAQGVDLLLCSFVHLCTAQHAFNGKLLTRSSQRCVETDILAHQQPQSLAILRQVADAVLGGVRWMVHPYR